jgi:hypothetical protein
MVLPNRYPSSHSLECRYSLYIQGISNCKLRRKGLSVTIILFDNNYR